MLPNQNETPEMGRPCSVLRDDFKQVSRRPPVPSRHPLFVDPTLANRPSRQAALTAFTLTELLVVITIIAILAGLITGAALGALNKAKQAAITLELQQLASAMDQFKQEMGAYPPNVFANGSAELSLTSNDQEANTQELTRMLKKAFPRAVEFQNKPHTSGSNNTFANVGLSPAEALVFWLQGFSNDPTRPLSGPDLSPTQIDDNGTSPRNVITIDSFDSRYDFDRGRLRFSRNPDGSRRFISIRKPNVTVPFQWQLYEYFPSGSQEPFVYFDTSRHSPLQIVDKWDTTEFFYSSPHSGGKVFPLKQLRAAAPELTNMDSPTLQYVEYVNAKKCQVLHCGLDDAWGDFSNSTGAGGELDVTNRNFIPQLLYPEGPFIGDTADTLASFVTGALEDEQE
ncbi:MAG: type II secretion system GspH family protein [Pirellulales bacterium]|nr:type II secretion system GspH family protein [Pirellulales bacterium]